MKCDCASCTPGWCLGEAILVVERGGENRRVCTRCTLTEDKVVARLFCESDMDRFVELESEVAARFPQEFWNDAYEMLGGMRTLLRSYMELPLLVGGEEK